MRVTPRGYNHGDCGVNIVGQRLESASLTNETEFEHPNQSLLIKRRACSIYLFWYLILIFVSKCRNMPVVNGVIG